MIGMAKAAVFPVPVWAQPSTSFRANIAGIAASCIGVGCVYPSASRAFSMFSSMLSCLKVVGSNDKIILN